MEPTANEPRTLVPSEDVLASMGNTALRELVTRLQRELATREDQAGMLTDDRNTANAALAEFKRRVVEVAAKYGKRHNWCQAVAEALNELGLEPPMRAMKARVRLHYDIEFEVPWGATVDEAYVLNAVDFDTPDWDTNDDEVWDLEPRYDFAEVTHIRYADGDA